MATAPGVWETLSHSSKRAVRWAAAAARVRIERDGLSAEDAEVDEFDLLVGILLAHPRDSEPRALLEHVGATAADLLPPDYPMPTGELLKWHVQSVPADESPELAGEVENALFEATSSFIGADGVVEPRGIYGALRSGTNRVAMATYDLLARTGLSAAADSYREYMSGPPDVGYADFLAQRHPYTAQPVEIPSYKADHGPGSKGDDYVDIRAEVDAFAYLLASRALQPPLAIGLFGHWGTGKTYFMDAVRSRIEQLVRSDAVAKQPQADVPFWKRVIQIEFNAWHYVEGDLWASLVEHVFSELRVHNDEDQTEVAKRQRHWLEKIDEKLRQRGDLLLVKQEKTDALKDAKDQLVEAEQNRVSEVAKLEKAQQAAARPVLLENSLGQLKESIAGLVDDRTSGKAAEAFEAIEDARAELKRGLGLVRGFRWSDPKTWLAIIALVGVPVLVWFLGQQAELPGTTQVFAGLSALLATVTGALRGATGQVRSRLDALDKAAAAVRAEVDTKRETLDKAVDTASERAAAAEAAVEKLVRREEALVGEIELLQRQATGVTSGALLSEFVSERVGSIDYRTRLGTAALVQRDFRALSKLIEEQNAERVASDTGDPVPGPDVLNRIILYVDDLDRCEAEQVVAVLQAVHLLLAFPLFVVVVAVDSRWLSQSLAEHYPALAGTPGSEHASPSDYLEKIFQVPFWIEPLSESARSSMVRGLLQANLVRGAAGNAGGDDDKLDIDDEQRALLDAMFTHRTAIRMQTAALSVTVNELKFLDELGPLLGTTPRSIKRFVNVYQLLCALPPTASPAGTPPYEELAAFLLAITDGLPSVTTQLRERIELILPGDTLATAMLGLRPMLPLADVARYDLWLAEHPGWDNFPLEILKIPAARVRRFSFR